MQKHSITLSVLAFLLCCSALAATDIDGDWEIHSSVGGATPITVNCTLQQQDNILTGTCTPVMENPQPSELTGSITGDTAVWGYDVIFNGNAGRVDFMADTVTATEISGTLSLSGTAAPFTAVKK
jgi:hypothetical protein